MPASRLPEALRAIEDARKDANAAYGTESRERAKGEVTVSPDISRIVFGAEGNNPAKNPKSSASGYGQFIDSTFVSLYRKEFSNLASGMTDAAILAMKSDRGVNEKLVEAYARDNAVKLNAAGLNGNRVENQYLAHNYGPAGAIGLLKADPNASATSVLGQGVANANPAVAGHTVQDVINESYGRAQRYSGVGRAQANQVISDRASSEAYDKPAAAAARLAAIQEQLNQDREKGGELGERYATAEDLIKAKTDTLTPALKGQRDEIMKLADERARAAGTKLGTTFAIDTSEAYGALGRSANEQSAYTTAKQFGAPGSEGFRSAYDEALKLKELTDAKSDTGGFLKGLAADMMNGVKAGQALENQLKRIVAKIADRAIDGLVNGLFSGLGGGDSKGGAAAGSGGGFNFGSIFSSVGKIFGFDSGGFTGPGGKFEPAGVVHRGEVVWSQADVGRWGGAAMVDAMRRSRGFADGGIVGPIVTPKIPMARPAGMASGTNVTHAPTFNVDARGAQAGVADQISAALQGYNAHLTRNLPAMVGAAQRRGF